MKTAKVTGKKGKSEKQKKTLTVKKPKAGKRLPGEDEIREKAIEIYNRRIESGEHGTAESDWHEAEKMLLNE
jgi:hypothetical protein